VLELLQLDSIIDAVSDGNSVTRSKPAPDLFLHAAAQLDLPPGECVVVEDAEAGVEAAHNGGMRAIGLGPQERVGRAELVMPDLANARLQGILARLEALLPPQAMGQER
jgi:beta-phosphoglucomutase-like phosphatase (HAD superfamily)